MTTADAKQHRARKLRSAATSHPPTLNALFLLCFFVYMSRPIRQDRPPQNVLARSRFPSALLLVLGIDKLQSVISRTLSSGKPSAGATMNALARSSGAKVNGLANVFVEDVGWGAACNA